MTLLSIYRLYPPTVCDWEVVYFGVAATVAVLLLAEPDEAAEVADELLFLAKASAGDATGATIAMVSIRVSIILTAVRMIVLFDSESVLFFMTQVLLCDSCSIPAVRSGRAGKVSFTVKSPLRKLIIASENPDSSEHPLRKA